MSRRAAGFLLLLAAAVALTACSTVAPARTYSSRPLLGSAYSDAAEASLDRVIGKGDPSVCPDPTTQRTPSDELSRRGSDWRDDFAIMNSIKLQGPRMTYRAPIVDYPKDLMHGGVPGAVLLLLLIDTDGSVQGVIVACATDDRFAEVAARAARLNRYAPMVVDGKTVRSSAYLPYSYATAP
jgi:Gram-negative bacterial TonB protein C-terminal